MNYYVTLPNFLFYIGTVLALAALFIAVYVRLTPHHEIALIKQGNTAVAVQMVGTFVGWCLPMAAVISHAVNLVDMILWSIVAAAIQLLVFFIASRISKNIRQKLEEGCVASGVFVGGFGFGVGILNAACMVP